MPILYYVLSALFVIATFIPLIPYPHWFFRIFDFAKVQILILQSVIFLAAWFLVSPDLGFYITQTLLLVCISYEISLLYKYTPFYKIKKVQKTGSSSQSIRLISFNVYQFNKKYQKFIDFIQKTDPDIIFTMESNQEWEKAMQVLKSDYPYFHEIALENTYGMHLYSKLEISNSITHYFVADDIPSIEAVIKTKDGSEFIFFGVHPPPPSPTEEENSKERDGELLSVAKRIRNSTKTTLAVGDFNNVAWARSSVLFRKTSQMIDPRIGRGLISTFHARYRLLRFPIDQMFHTTDIFVEEIVAEKNIGSDHLPLYCRFFIDKVNESQETQKESLAIDEVQEVNEMIEEGKEEESDREAVVTE